MAEHDGGRKDFDPTAMQAAIDSSTNMEDGIMAMIAVLEEAGQPVPPAYRVMLEKVRGNSPVNAAVEEAIPAEEIMEETTGDVVISDVTTSGDIEVLQNDSKTTETPVIKVAGKKTMRRMKPEELSRLNLDKIGDKEGQSLIPANENGEDIFILQTQNEAFKLPSDHPMIQQAQLEVASTLINGIQSRSAIDRAGAIKAALKQHGFNFKGDTFELLRFAVEAMDIVIEFEKRQTQMRMIDVQQAGLLQLQGDITLSGPKFLLLPAHRRMNAAIYSQAVTMRAMEEIITDGTVAASENMMVVHKNMEEMRKDTRSMMMESVQEAVARAVQTTSGAAKQILIDLGTSITEVSGGALERLQGLLLGQEAVDAGTVNALLDSMGNAGTKFKNGLKNTGEDAVEFFKNLVKKNSPEEE